MVRLRRLRMQDLLEEYGKLRIETDAYMVAYKKIPLADTASRLKIAKEIIHSSARANEVMLKVIDRFSPTASKALSFKLKNHIQNAEEQLNEDYTLPKFRGMSESVIKSVINSTIDNSIMFTELIQQIIHIAFITAVEAIKRTKGKPQEELDEYLKSRLLKLGFEYVELYEGAWQALESEKSDRFRHCATSTRELVKKFLGEKGSERRVRLKSILKSENEVKLAESLADSVEALYDVLSKGVHKEIDYETALLSLKVTEHLFRYIFERESSI
jgi:hypothetical protein